MAFAEDLPPEAEWKEQGVCARVRIRISQDVTLTRTAFRATLEIDNSPDNVQLENLTVKLEIKDSADQLKNTLFGGADKPELTGISDVSGTGIILPGTSAKAVWTLIPTQNAAPDAPVQYYVGGTMSYTQSGTQMNMPLFPAMILVKPDPKLVLDYFLVRNVYSDDPFTADVIEPAEPFPLGLILKNEGKGTAHNVKIVSSQPQIIDNEKGLMVDFKIIGTQVNTEQVSPSLTANFGEIGPGQTAVAQWMMTASLQGKFIKDQNMVKFEHVNDLGIPGLSLIERVNIHQIIHAVRVDIPNDDNKPDFLADDVDDPNFMPDTLYNSDGTTSSVNVATNAAITGQLDSGNLQVKLTATAPAGGWVYIRADDPGQDKFRLKKVIRSDGREIRIEDNAWTTHRTIRLTGQEPVRQNLVHVFDYISNTCEYTLIYESLVDTPAPPVLMFIPDRSITEGIHFGFIVKASDPNLTIPTLSVSSLPTGATFKDNGNGEGIFDWGTAKAGVYEVTFTASDGALTTSQKTKIAIYSKNDSDGDGMPDEWEMKYFGNLSRDGKGDSDGDGVSDLDEYLNGTDQTVFAYYPFNGNANDMGGNAHATVNEAVLTKDRFGSDNGAYNFNGTTSYISTPVDINPDKMPVMTMSAWVYPRKAATVGRQEVLSSDNGNFSRSLLIENNRWHVFTGGSNWDTTVPTVLNQCQHVAVVFEASDIKFYRNGVMYAYGKAPGKITSINKLMIGDNPVSYPEFFDGIIDDVRIYKRALAKEEVQAFYPKLTSVAISGLSTVPENGSKDYKLMATYSDGMIQDLAPSAVWTENSNYASFDTSVKGRLKTVAVTSNQTVTLTGTYTFNGVNQTASMPVTIEPKSLNSVTITGGALSIKGGSYSDYKATAVFNNGKYEEDVTKSVVWAENSTYASMDYAIKGRLKTSTVRAEQKVTLTARYTYKGVAKTGSVSVTITVPPGLKDLSVTGSSGVNEKSYGDYTATATFEDGSTKDVSSSATWTDNSSYAYMDSAKKGRLRTASVSSNQAVTVTARYTFNGVTKTALFPVTIINIP
jgi:hypothetical protein